TALVAAPCSPPAARRTSRRCPPRRSTRPARATVSWPALLRASREVWTWKDRRGSARTVGRGPSSTSASRASPPAKRQPRSGAAAGRERLGLGERRRRRVGILVRRVGGGGGGRRGGRHRLGVLLGGDRGAGLCNCGHRRADGSDREWSGHGVASSRQGWFVAA